MSRLPGPVCADSRKLSVEKSAPCSVKGKPPSPVGNKLSTLWDNLKDSARVQLKKLEYLEIARSTSYLMQGKSLYQSGKKKYDEWSGEEKKQRVQSYLGGKFLRMYLDGEVDESVVKDAGEEIGESQEFKSLAVATEKHIQSQASNYTTKPFTEKSIRDHADKYLKEKKTRTGIDFKMTLNTVIGGATGVEVDKARVLSKTQVGKEFELEYEIEVVFHDIYDFKNKRKGEFDEFRKQAADLLKHNDFDEFEKLVFGQVLRAVFDSKNSKLDDAAVFAAFMYALEQKGWTPGSLAWKVAVPMRGKVRVKY